MRKSVQRSAFSVQKNSSIAQQCIPSFLIPHSSFLILKISQGDF